MSSGHAHDGANAGRHAKSRILRHVRINADDALLHDLERETAARGIALHEAADIDVSLGNDAVEWCHDRGVVPVLMQLLDQVRVRRDVVLRSGDRGILGVEVLEIDSALLAGYPALLDQRGVAAPGHLREPLVGLGLVQGRFELVERRLVLRNLVVELRHRKLRQQFSGPDMVADVDIALDDIARRATVNICRVECGRRAWQCD